MEKINETNKTCFFEKINKIGQDWPRKKEKGIKLLTSGIKGGDIITSLTKD
jgi:hypothetical protein